MACYLSSDEEDPRPLYPVRIFVEEEDNITLITNTETALPPTPHPRGGRNNSNRRSRGGRRGRGPGLRHISSDENCENPDRPNDERYRDRGRGGRRGSGRGYRGSGAHENRERTESRNNEILSDREDHRGNRSRSSRRRSEKFCQQRWRSTADLNTDELGGIDNGNGAVRERRSSMNRDHHGNRTETFKQQKNHSDTAKAHKNTEEGNRSDQPDRPKTPFLSFSKLVSLSKKEDPDELLLEIANERSGLREFLEQPLNPKSMYYLMRTIIVAISSTLMKSRRELLQLLEGNLLSQLSELFNDVSMKSARTSVLYRNVNEFVKICKWTIEILKAVMQALQSSLGKCKSVISALREVQTTFQLDSVDPNFAMEMESVQEYLNEVIIARQKQTNDLQRGRLRKQVRDMEMQLPPDDFREIGVLPRAKDLALDEKPFLRANKAEGKYNDLDMYLDIQFRLLREDYINPLRTGITEYKAALKSGASVKKFRDIRLYNSVQIIRPVCSSRGIEYIIQFDVSNFKSMNWSISRRLLHGSLLCLSRDDFETMFYATVTERDVGDLKDGLLRVHFEEDSLPDIGQNEKLIMAETTAYFEAYRHILEGLKDMQDTMPFQQYLIECETNLKPPKYLLHAGGPQYDFKSILAKNYKNGHSVYPVLNTLRWPNEQHLGFDTSQLEAMKLAITKELAIIQGPPGTGKTYVGLQIAKVLMDNADIWNKSNTPILVVCYTNHALDQFLEGILTFCHNGIVRVGGRCSNEQLEPFVLKNLKKTKREDKSRTWGIMQSERDCRKLLRESETQIMSISSKLKKTTTKLVSFDKLEPFMTEEQQNSFYLKLHAEQEKQYIPIWLQLKFDTESSSANPATIGEEMKLFWKSYIIESVPPMSEESRMKIRNIWDLDLLQRAQLYKVWADQFIIELEKRKQQCTLENFSNQQKLTSILDIIEKSIEQASTEILPGETLSSVITDGCTKQQIIAVCKQPPNTSIKEWLCLDGKEISASTIQMAVENNVETDSSTEPENLDLEEDRRLDDDDDDDDDFLHDYAVACKKSKKTKKLDSGGWLMQWNEKKFEKKIKYMLSTAKHITEDEAESISDVWRAPVETKQALYRYWVSQYRQQLKSVVQLYEESFCEATNRLREVRDQETVEIIRGAKFVGMTTTGAAKNREILQRVRPRIVIVEEAAEVLESHIVTTLNRDCQHLILIGDHKQLRPSTTVYELSKKYHLDISLFERMIRNGVPCVTLSQQHRMRPEISVLMRYPKLYPNLQDHPCVKSYDKVLGLDTNVQFINHDHEESRSSESTSYSNAHEARFMAAFCRYLLNQGYTSDQITVITPYMGQVILLRKEMPKTDFGVRITAVDNFQGEENDIILLSLVRSSSIESKFTTRNPIGFLGIENRICVALSRAKKGFYVIGNFTLLQEHSEMWKYMTDCLVSSGCLRRSVTLRCQVHPDTTVLAEDPSDFRKSPEGGCEKSCSFRLQCGHFCPRACHILDKEHKYSKCFKPCIKTVCSLGHSCKKKCYQDCGPCSVKVEKTIPMCKHLQKMECHADPYKFLCKVACDFDLPCGHKCRNECGTCTKENKHKQRCKEIVLRHLKCGHSMKLFCFQDPNETPCPEPCTALLDCQHKCKGTCSGCFRGKIHKGCKGTCNKQLPCGHKCNFPCSYICPPCNRKCEWTCSHGKTCKHLCSEECEKCSEDCKYACGCKAKDALSEKEFDGNRRCNNCIEADKPQCNCRRKCSKRCDEECDGMGKCDQPCPRKAKCGIEGHGCIGLCGEKCIPFCKECNVKEFEEKCDESVKYSRAAIELPDCKCIVGVQRMDIIMEQEPGTRDDIFKSCPRCNKPIRKDIKRYSTVLKRCRKAIAEKYLQITGTKLEKKQKTISLVKSVTDLRKEGLEPQAVSVLLRRLENDAFGVLHRMDQTVDIITDLLKASKRLKDLEASKAIAISDLKDVISPKDLQGVLLHEHKYATKQFWNEVKLEVSRLEMIGKFFSLKHAKFAVGHKLCGGVDLRPLLDRSVQILLSDLPFDQRRQDTITRVYDRLEKA